MCTNFINLNNKMINLYLILSLSLFILFLVIFFSYYYIKYYRKKYINNYSKETNKNNCDKISNNNKNKPLIILGPSGVGKDTFIKKIISKYPNIFIKCVSCTTRLPRQNEKEGFNYFFINKKQFEEMEKNGEIFGKFEKYGNLYGTSIKQLEKISSKEKIVFFDYNIETVRKIHEQKNIEFNFIALLPPDMNVLEERLRKRGTDSDESINERIIYAKKEIQLIKQSKFINFVVINGELEESFIQFEKSIKFLYSHLFE